MQPLVQLANQVRLGLACGAVGLIVFYVITQQYVLFWATSIIYLASAYFIHRYPSRLPDVPHKSPRLDVAAFVGLF